MDISLLILIVLPSAKLVLASPENATYIGCYDIPSEKLPDRTEDVPYAYMALHCIEYCYNNGYQFTAIRRVPSDECGCGLDLPFVSDKVDDSSCTNKCPGNRSLTCGGYSYYSVYDTQSLKTNIDVDRMEGFLYGYPNGVGFINLTKPDETQTIARVPERVKQVDFHWKKQMVFLSTLSHKYSSTLNGNSSVNKLGGVPMSSCDPIAVDWLHDRLIWADCDSNVLLKSSDLEGANTVTLVDRKVNYPLNRIEVDPIFGKIFWMFSKTIESCSLDGTNLEINITGTSFFMRGLALDLPSRRLFFVGLQNNGPATLCSLAYSAGNQLTTHWGSDQMRAVYGLSVFRGIVYWTNYEGNKDVMFKAPLNGSSPARKIAPVSNSVWHIRLVHPDLQPPGGDPCDNLQCSHLCNSGRCVCPEGSHLAPDQRNCRGDSESLANVTFVGCFGATSESSIGESTFHIENTTLGKCVDQCRVHNARFVAVDLSSRTCHCGPDIPYESAKFDDGMCDSSCPDYQTVTCGGDGVHSVYDLLTDGTTTVIREGAGMLVGTSNGVFLFNTSRKFEYDSLRRSNAHVDAVDYHWQKKIAFSVDTTGKLFRFPLSMTNGNEGNNMSMQIHSMPGSCDGFAVDWVHDRIFWAHCEEPDSYDYEEDSINNYVVSIRTINLDGQDERTVVTRNTKEMIKRMAVDPYAGKLFWISGGHNVESCDLDGSELNIIFKKNASQSGRAPPTIRDIFLDLPSRRVFYVADTNLLALSSMDYSGGDRKDHWTNVAELRYVYGLGVVNGIVYWVNWFVMKSDVLYQAPLSDPSKLAVIREVKGVWHMRVVHPSLQSDPCAVAGCNSNTKCEDPQSTSCQCPKHCNMADNYSSDRSLGVAPVAESVFLGALLLAVLVSAAAVMLYFSDKYWPLIRSRITRTSVPSYRHSRDSFPDGAVSEDHMNLVED